jgi:transposase
MDSIKYVGMDVHKETVSIAVRNQAGKVVMDTVIETRANAILDCIRGIRGELHITFEEGTWAAWLYDLLHPHVARVIVCDPRRNALLTEGNKGDKVDAHRLAALLRDGGMLRPVYHGEHSLRSLRELARSYLVLTQDVTRVMNRTKALYRGWGIPCGGQQVYAANHREAWLSKLPETGVRRRAEHFYQELDALRALRQQARRDLLTEARKQPATHWLRQVPYIGPIWSALLVALLQTPHRFRTKRQLWSYCGLAIRTSSSADYRFVDGELKRSKKSPLLRGLNTNHNHALKNIFKHAAMGASCGSGPLREFYDAQVAQGKKPAMARLTLARKIAAITLAVWKQKGGFDAAHLKLQA